jgi:tRNA threonylcarbamoyladenosine biosynthesis protein TsaE
MTEISVHSTSVAETQAWAAKLAAVARRGDLIVLVGGLGAGKTRFAQGFARALGVEGPVTSPTFTLVRQYPLGEDQAAEELLHADLWRLDESSELGDLSIPELLEDRAIALIEWGERAGEAFGRDRLAVNFSSGPGDEERTLSLDVHGDRFASRLVEIRAAWGQS